MINLNNQTTHATIENPEVHGSSIEKEVKKARFNHRAYSPGSAKPKSFSVNKLNKLPNVNKS